MGEDFSLEGSFYVLTTYPQKPFGDFNSCPHYRCPVCHKAVVFYEDDPKPDFCPWCKQELDWGKRNNPEYPHGQCFAVRECEKCGEFYEPFCEMKHICKKQNSYPKEENV